MLRLSAPSEEKSGIIIYNGDLDIFPRKEKDMGNIKGVFFFKREILQNMGQDKIFKIISLSSGWWR